jgi:peptide/nickel transport system substrate-binding protein
MVKRIMVVLLAVLMAASVFARSKPEVEPPVPVKEESEEAPAAMAKYGEAPMLAELVAKGELPPVDERLPKNPVVLKTGMLMPPEILEVEIGTYGGEFIDTRINNVCVRENLFVTTNLGDVTSGNILEEWSFNDDFTVYTFKLREGIRWSDGMPVTTEDVRFCYEDVMMNPTLMPAIPGLLRAGGAREGEPMKLAIVDDYTWRMTFTDPHPEFTVQLRQIGGGYYELIKPKHYLAQFHTKYASEDTIDKALKEEDLDDWAELFDLKDLTGFNYFGDEEMIGMPTLAPWIPIEYEPDRVIAERNPYYFAVDAEGNQLPYIDRVINLSPEGGIDYESAMMKMFGREADYMWNASLDQLPLMKENEEKGDYTVYLYGGNGSRAFFLNLTYDDPIWREAVWDVRFRRAVNFAINKQEIIDELYFGLGDIPRAIPGEYSPDKANSLLNEVGLTKRDSEGFRLRSDGQPFSILLEVYTPQYINAAQLIVEHLKAVGLKADFRTTSGDLLGQRLASNEVQATITWNRACTWDVRHNHDYIPNNQSAPLWANWYGLSGGDATATGIAAENAEEPPDWMKGLYFIHEEIMSVAPGSAADKAAMKKLYAWYNENVPTFTFIDAPALMHVFSNRIGNVPSSKAYHHGQWWVRKVQYIKE